VGCQKCSAGIAEVEAFAGSLLIYNENHTPKADTPDTHNFDCYILVPLSSYQQRSPATYEDNLIT
jgi:hypothetical protein